MAGSEIDRLVQALSRLPGLGPRSARRAALHLIEKKESALRPLARALDDAADAVTTCSLCYNVDTTDPCAICAGERRDRTSLCVVENVADLWAMERAGVYSGLYHVLGGVLSAIDGVGPEDLKIPALLKRVADGGIKEVILATNVTHDGQTTAHYIADRLAEHAGGVGIVVSGLAHGMPMGGELDYLDEGTLMAALKARRPV